MEWNTTSERRPIRRNALRWGLALTLVGVAICTAAPAGAVARLGGQTDDSVCDVGSTASRSREWPEAAEFVRAKCRNGQLLLGSSVVPAGNFDPEITVLARAFCRIADIQARRIAGSAGPLMMEFEEVHCRIEKLPK